ncbi:MAG: DUF3732 domain-containing protein [Fulvivirga sp.]
MQISKIVLWPLKEEEKKLEISFKLGKVNYIVGSPKTGKSSIWPIVDYCLGSSKLRVPFGPTRDCVLWYGVEFMQSDGDLVLIARKNNSLKNSKSEWHYDKSGTIPDKLDGNKRWPEIKEVLSSNFDEFLKGADKNLIKDLKNSGYGMVSFRDLLVLNHQIQYSLVNPVTLFLKNSDDISVSKIKKLIPYILYQSHIKATSYLKKKLWTQWNTLKSELRHLMRHMKNIYVEANELGMVTNYQKPRSKWSIDEYLQILNEVKADHKFLLKKNPEKLGRTEVDQILMLGRIEECISYSEIIERSNELGDDYYRVKDEHIIESNEIVSPLTSNPAIKNVSDLIKSYAEIMDLHYSNYAPYYDSKEAILKFEDADNNKISLQFLGSIADYVGYNISTFLAFHETFRDNELSFIPSFLFIDQPSHGFSDNFADQEKLQLLYRALNQAVINMNGKFQIIVLEGLTAKDPLERFAEESIIQEWLSEGLIPKSWQIE